MTGEGRYLEAAEGVAAVYVRLQGADGTWPLKMTLADGKPVGDNRLIPVATVLPMLEKLAKLTGKAEYRRAADRALASVLDARVSNWNWEGQFEDVPPNAPYTDLTKHDACATASIFGIIQSTHRRQSSSTRTSPCGGPRGSLWTSPRLGRWAMS